MPSRPLVRSFVALWWTLGVALLIGSIQTVIAALGAPHHANPHILLLGAVESVAALLFLIPKTMRFGAAGLLLVLFLAFLIHALDRSFRWDLLVYAASALFVAVHGSLSGAQWQAILPARAVQGP